LIKLLKNETVIVDLFVKANIIANLELIQRNYVK